MLVTMIILIDAGVKVRCLAFIFVVEWSVNHLDPEALPNVEYDWHSDGVICPKLQYAVCIC